MGIMVWTIPYGPYDMGHIRYNIQAFKVFQDQINTIQFGNEAIFSPDTIFKAEDEAFDLEGLVLNFFTIYIGINWFKARMMNSKRKI